MVILEMWQFPIKLAVELTAEMYGEDIMMIPQLPHLTDKASKFRYKNKLIYLLPLDFARRIWCMPIHSKRYNLIKSFHEK